MTSGIVRQLKGSDTASGRCTPSNTVLVVGSPGLDGWATFPTCPGALADRRVRELFARAGYAIGEAIDAQDQRIVDNLHARADWRDC